MNCYASKLISNECNVLYNFSLLSFETNQNMSWFSELYWTLHSALNDQYSCFYSQNVVFDKDKQLTFLLKL